jgi:type I restriction enzyme S subunit
MSSQAKGDAYSPAGWTATYLPDLIGQGGLMTDGDWVESKDQDPNGQVRLIQLADVGDGVFKDKSERFLNKKTALRLNCTILQPGDLLIARMPDPLGRACVFGGLGQECCTVVDVCIVRPGKQCCHTSWLMHFMNTPHMRAQVASLQSGSTRKRISKGNLSTIPLPIPPLPEQLRIADALDSYLTRLDAATEGLKRVEANLKRYRASVLKAAVEGHLVPTEAEVAKKEKRTYEPASVLLERILKERRHRWEQAELAKLKAKGEIPKNDAWKKKYEEPASPDTSSLPDLPEGWCWATVEQIAEVSGGVTKNAGRVGATKRLSYLRVANVYADELRLEDIEQIAVTDAEYERVLLRCGDILVVEGNGSIDQIGRVAIWDGSIQPCVHQNHIIKARMIHAEPMAAAKWMLTWLMSPGGRGVITRTASSTSGLHTLSLSKVNQLPVPLAPEVEQGRIAEAVGTAISCLDAANRGAVQSQVRLARLRQSILRWAFEGKLVDQDPNDEPASVLLERIRSQREASETLPRRNHRR